MRFVHKGYCGYIPIAVHWSIVFPYGVGSGLGVDLSHRYHALVRYHASIGLGLG